MLAELRGADRFLLATHENPDGDALGSLAGMQLVLAALGKDAVAYMAPGEFPLPYEYRFIQVENLVTEPPADLDGRTIVFLDCGNIDRNPADALKREGAHILNVDHHHDNTQFGTVNHVVPEASCTAEVIWDLMGDLGVELTRPIAEALYVGLVTDTGKFMYENTGPARAPDGGRPDQARASTCTRSTAASSRACRRASSTCWRAGSRNVERFDGGLLTLTHLSVEDYEATGADASYSEGVVDHLRALEGTAVAGLVRDLLGDGEQRRKVSLRATDDRVDVSAIARAQGGGGHRRAAGFSTTMDYPQLVEVLRASLAEQL